MILRMHRLEDYCVRNSVYQKISESGLLKGSYHEVFTTEADRGKDSRAGETATRLIFRRIIQEEMHDEVIMLSVVFSAPNRSSTTTT